MKTMYEQLWLFDVAVATKEKKEKKDKERKLQTQPHDNTSQKVNLSKKLNSVLCADTWQCFNCVGINKKNRKTYPIPVKVCFM